MKIYFVLLRPGYWESFVTTNESLAKAKLSKNPEYRLRESDLRPVDFVPEKTTGIHRIGAMSITVNHEDYFYFSPVYKADTKPDWVQGVRSDEIELLSNGVEIAHPEEDMFGHGVHFKIPE